jgi:hypothetical protein
MKLYGIIQPEKHFNDILDLSCSFASSMPAPATSLIEEDLGMISSILGSFAVSVIDL